MKSNYWSFAGKNIQPWKGVREEDGEGGGITQRWNWSPLSAMPTSTAVGTLKTIFRSLIPRNVMQEAFALVAAYNLVRSTMAEAAERHQIDPSKISFVGSLRALALMLPRMKRAPSSRLLKLYEQLLLDIAEALIDRPRRGRHYPRVVRVKMSNFKLKRAPTMRPRSTSRSRSGSAHEIKTPFAQGHCS